jgi:hypothetical protein
LEAFEAGPGDMIPDIDRARLAVLAALALRNLSGAPVLNDRNRAPDPRSPPLLWRFQAQRSPALTRRGFVFGIMERLPGAGC